MTAPPPRIAIARLVLRGIAGPAPDRAAVERALRDAFAHPAASPGAPGTRLPAGSGLADAAAAAAGAARRRGGGT